MNILKSLGQSFKRERTPADLARWLDLPEAELRQWLGHQPAWSRGFDYLRFTIPKRRGGQRHIEAPNDRLKALQRRVLQRLLNPLPLPPEVTGFAPGRSIVDNARPHAGQGVVINLDLADFFPSINAARVEALFRGLGWNAEAARILTAICTHNGRLPQGAPTSPALGNLACRRLDRRVAALVRCWRGQYTRYADDLTISFSAFGKNRRLRPRRGPRRSGYQRPAGPPRSLLRTLRQIIEDEGFGLQLKKRVRVQRAHQRQTATGLVVNRQVNLPRRTRRLIRAMQHRHRQGALDAAGERRLQGLLALQRMVEAQRNAPGARR